MLYREAFGRNDNSRYQKYLEAVESGKTKINASTLYPSDLVNIALYNRNKVNKTIDLQWNALPDYLANNPHNGLVVADVSGSMTGTPMCVSVALAMYFAERNIGSFQDHFITFSSNPQLQKIQGDTFTEKVDSVSRSDWGMSTDLMATFRLIFVKERENLSQEDMPEVLYIISDMQFNTACRNSDVGCFKTAQIEFEAVGISCLTFVSGM